MDEACLCEKQKHAYELMKDRPYLQAKIYAGGETVFLPSQMLEWSWNGHSVAADLAPWLTCSCCKTVVHHFYSHILILRELGDNTYYAFCDF